MTYLSLFTIVGACGKLWIIIYLLEAIMFGILITISILCLVGLVALLMIGW